MDEKTPAETAKTRSGTVVAGRYELSELVGRGGMARVYRGRDRLLRRVVAVKLLRPEYGRDPAAVARFRREAHTAARLDSPRLVGVYDAGVDRGVCYLIMPLLEGTTLRALLDRHGALAPGQVAAIGAGIAEGLAAMHAAGFAHGDVKPHNVMVGPEGRVTLIDFGLAAPVGAPAERGPRLGTADYVAPEQALGGGPDAASDRYALGVVLFEAVAGRLPFPGPAPLDALRARVDGPAPPLRSAAPGAPAALAALIDGLLARDPGRRRSAAACAGALAGLRDPSARVASPAGQ